MESSNKTFLSWTLDVSYSNRKTPSSIRTQLKALCSALVSLLSWTVRTAVPRGDCGSLPHFCHRSVSWWNSWPSRYFRMRGKSKIFQDEGQNRNYCLFILKALGWTLPVTAARAELDSKQSHCFHIEDLLLFSDKNSSTMEEKDSSTPNLTNT